MYRLSQHTFSLLSGQWYKKSLKMRKPLKHPILYKEAITWSTVFLCGRLHPLYIRSTVIFKGSRAQRLKWFQGFNCHWQYFMTWLRTLLNGNGYKNVLEVYISNENTFTRMIMKRSDNRPEIRLRSQTMQLHAKNNILLKSLKSGARCLNFSLEVIDWNIRNPKLVPGGEMTEENYSYISNLSVDSDVHSVILILDTCKGIYINT